MDGVIESGEATINEAPITGESMPAIRFPGDSVYAGTILMAGTIRIRVTGVGSETVVGKLIERVELAQALRPQIQTIGDRFAKKGRSFLVPGGGTRFAGYTRPAAGSDDASGRLSLRGRAGHADRDERLHWELRTARHSGQGRNAPRIHGGSRHRGFRQDRHPDREPAEREPGDSVREWLHGGARSVAGGAGGNALAASAGDCDSLSGRPDA